ncbi:hypothetical protein FRX31_026337 [Thalictrum thalictroides]|uniref:Uncharacterized protein n=1 Tax=Thalictrum thalictroides TaxID=46969 RepID=A0A7J6VG39_THATH|nr:hypothetical protein FRX31_026337 [Thalictrum thalictroides]
MGRPSRAVRSARDRWFRQKRFNPVLARLFAAVRGLVLDISIHILQRLNIKRLIRGCALSYANSYNGQN